VALLTRERPQEIHPGLLLDQQVRGVLPRPAEGRRHVAVERDELLPFGKDAGDLRVGPLLLAGHQVDVELVAVQAHVQDVERAHRGPAVLVPERQRDQASPCILVASALNSSHVFGTV
jgi:hypothetical protein